MLGEDGLIALFGQPGGALGDKVVVANGDDAAAWFVEPRYVSLITTDTLVEGVHFDLSYTPAHAVGQKLLAVSLSDIAAMGARPRYALLSVSFPPNTPAEIAERIALGARECAKQFGVAIIGGNTTRTSGPIVLASTVIGRAEPHEIVRRRGTHIGDVIFVTGTLGDARGGLHLAKHAGRPAHSDHRLALFDALIAPRPRVEVGRRLAQASLLHAMCDVSDGLGRDLRRLLEPEGLGARLDANLLPISAALRAYAAELGQPAEPWAIAGGEDYELLFTADPADERAIIDTCASIAVPVTRIGHVTTDTEIEVIMTDGSVVPAATGFEHFGVSR